MTLFKWGDTMGRWGVLLIACYMIGSCTVSAVAEEWDDPWLEKEGTTVAISTAPRPVLETEDDWRRELRSAKIHQAEALSIGGGLLLGGVAFYVKGAAERISAGNVPGCYTVTGHDVACATPEGQAEADRRLQKGKRDVTIGLVAALASAGFAIAGRSASVRRKELEKLGQERGWRLSAGPKGDFFRVVFSFPYGVQRN